MARNGALCCHANGAKHEEQGENDVFGGHDVWLFVSNFLHAFELETFKLHDDFM